MFEKWNREATPGCAVAVARGDQILKVACYGERDVETGDKITPNTAFYAASVSKQFVAACVAHLARRGKLSLDDDIRKHVPELADFGTPITVRHLVHHRSGLRELFDLVSWAGWSADTDLTPDKVIKLLSRQKELNFPPDSDFLYCNTGYFLLGVIVGRASNSSLRAYAAKNLFRPLQMTRSVFKDDPDQKIAEVAVGHDLRLGQYRPHRTRFALVGSGGLVTTVTDLVKWLRNFDRRDWGKDGLVDELQKPPVLKPSQKRPPGTGSYAFGLARGRYRGVPYVGHSGGSFGFRAYTIRFPEQKLYVALLANTSDLNAASLALKVADLYLGDDAQPVRAATAKSEATFELPRPRTFRDPRSGDLATLVPRPNGVRLATLSWRILMVPAGKNRLRSRGSKLLVTATMEDGGLVVEVKGQNPQRYAAVVAPQLSGTDLAPYLGTYASDELGSRIEIGRQGRGLRVKGRKVAYLPVATDVMVSVRGAQLDFVRGADKKIEAVRVSTGRSRHMLFRKID